MVKVKWLGVAGLEFRLGQDVLLVDPYISRPGKLRTLFAPMIPEYDSIDNYLESVDGKVRGILVGHTHSDHVLDVPHIVGRTGARAYGTESLSNLMGAYGLDHQAVIVRHGVNYQFGRFTACPIDSVHGHAILGMVPFPGVIKERLKPPLRVSQYKHGGPVAWLVTVNDRTYMQLGSADFIEENLKGVKVDVLFVCAAGRQYTPDFTSRLLDIIHPEVVVPFHFDDFFSPIPTGEEFPHVPKVDLDGFINEIQKAAPKAELVVPVPFKEMEL